METNIVRSKIQIKKIENIAARQVTFSKRKKGLFKKAQELSTLCDAEVGVIVFSSAAKLHDFSTSRMTQLIQRYIRHTGNIPQHFDSSILLKEDCVILRKELDEKFQELRQMEGENLEGLSIEELSKLERQINKSFARVRRMKDHKCQKVIADLQEKKEMTLAENRILTKKIYDATKVEVHTSKQQLSQNSTSLRLGLV